MPSKTLPKTTCLPSRNGVGTVVMKNCEPLPFGPAFWYLRQKGRGEGEAAGTYGHGEEPGFGVLQREVLVGEGLGAVDAGRAGAVAIEEVAALAHEVADLGRPRQSLRSCQDWANGWVI
jgi:hypothetical protein